MIHYKWNENWSTLEIYDAEDLLVELFDIFSEEMAVAAAQKWIAAKEKIQND